MRLTNNFDRLPIDTIATALSYVPSHERDVWLRMAMAIKSELGESGFQIWDDWSRTDQSYDPADARDVWKSVKPTGKVTIGTLIYEAQAHGYDHGKRPHQITDEELAERLRKREREEQIEAQKQARKHERAAMSATEMFEAAPSTREPIQHPYLTRKGIKNPGAVRVGQYHRWTQEGTITIDGALLIPIRDQSRSIVSLQAIFPSDANPLARDRDYLPGGKKQGGYFVVGAVKADSKTVLICEGYATGCTLHQSTGHPVVVAFDASNLPEVANIIRSKLPDATILICADNDQWTPPEKGGNAGVKKAAEASMLCRGLVAVPRFSDTTDDPTDFNDLADMEGESEVARQIDAVLNQKPANDNLPAAATGYDLAAVDWYSPFPDTRGKECKPLGTIENVAEACRRLGVTIRYNVISKEIEILIPGESFSVDNMANASLAWLTSSCTRFGIPTGNLGDAICYIGDKNQYNPVANWITSKPWDGTPRLHMLLETIKAEGEGHDSGATWLKTTLITRWLISAVAAAFRPNGAATKGVLVLQGEQNLGKTSWFKSLVPQHLGLIQDGLSLRPDDRDSVKQVLSYWMVELGELDATFRKADIAALKAFLGRDKDTLRRAYAKLESNYARRTVFFASVNPRQFLHDPTGNVRYWTISCEDINHNHGLDMQQVWAEVYESLYLHGESWFLSTDEVQRLNSHNKDYEVLDPITERLQSLYDWENALPSEWRWITATDVMHEIGYERPSRADVNQCGLVIGQLNGKKSRKSNGKKLLAMPPKLARQY